MPMKTFYVAYRSHGSNTDYGMYKLYALDAKDAIKAAKERYIKDFYDGPKEGKRWVDMFTFRVL